MTFFPRSRKKSEVLPLANVDAPAAAPDDHAGAGFADTQTGVGPGLARGDDADERRPRVAFRVGPVVLVPEAVALEGRDIVDRHVGDGRGHLAPELRRIEVRDGARCAAPAADALPEALAPDTEGRHDANAGHDHTRFA